MLKSNPMVPRDRPLIAIGYTYNVRKVLSFIVTDNAVITNTGITYLSKYIDQCANVAIRPVARPLVMSNCFLLLMRLTPTKKSRKSDLALDKWWVTQCGWLRLRTAVAMGMTITNCWKLFRYGVKRDHYEKLIGIR